MNKPTPEINIEENDTSGTDIVAKAVAKLHLLINL